MSQAHHILILSDGRPGHENQSLGLVEAVSRRVSIHYRVVSFSPSSPLPRRLLEVRGAIREADPPPHLMVGTGHRTHFPLLYARWRYRVPVVAIMKPSLPTRWFDLCLIPRHDDQDPVDRNHVIHTRGALNRLSEKTPVKTRSGLILLGGPSRHHHWEGDETIGRVREILERTPELDWQVADSRRTPPEFRQQLQHSLTGAIYCPHEETSPGWLPETLGKAEVVWVTEDSMSMVYEALTSGARVGLLPVPRQKSSGRLYRGLDELVADGLVVPFEEWRCRGFPEIRPELLQETGRCADYVVERFFKGEGES